MVSIVGNGSIIAAALGVNPEEYRRLAAARGVIVGAPVSAAHIARIVLECHVTMAAAFRAVEEARLPPFPDPQSEGRFEKDAA